MICTSSFGMCTKITRISPLSVATSIPSRPSGSSLVMLRWWSSSRDHTVRVWSVATTPVYLVFSLNSVVPSPDGRLLLTAFNDHTACITEMESSATKVEMRGHENTIEYAVFLPAAAAPSIRELISQAATSQIAKVDALGLSFVVTGSRDKTIKLWNALHGQCLWTFNDHDRWVQA
ncbi:WD40-repeat-containing domain protein [Daedaleopsis nitida]|nr:WD40-repeat-containing domain protein [Daedaleopsis nitida]